MTASNGSQTSPLAVPVPSPHLAATTADLCNRATLLGQDSGRGQPASPQGRMARPGPLTPQPHAPRFCSPGVTGPAQLLLIESRGWVPLCASWGRGEGSWGERSHPRPARAALALPQRDLGPSAPGFTGMSVPRPRFASVPDPG